MRKNILLATIAILVLLIATTVLAQVKKFVGECVNMDEANNTIIVKGETEMTFDVSKIKKIAKFAVGDKVNVVYAEKDGKNVAKAVAKAGAFKEKARNADSSSSGKVSKKDQILQKYGIAGLTKENDLKNPIPLKGKRIAFTAKLHQMRSEKEAIFITSDPFLSTPTLLFISDIPSDISSDYYIFVGKVVGIKEVGDSRLPHLQYIDSIKNN